jgi:dCTP deaminase
MILSDRELRIEIQDGHIKFEPNIDMDTQIQDASIDVRLGDALRVPGKLVGQILAPHERISRELQGQEATIPEGGYNLLPGGFVLGQTYEKITLPLHLAARLEGKSSLARLGLMIHFTSGHIAPGFDGIIILEILNHSHNIIALMPRMLVGQLIFEKLSMLPSKAYSGRYRGQLQP